MGVKGGVKLTGDEFCILLKVGENEVRQDVEATEQQHTNLKKKIKPEYQCKNILNKTRFASLFVNNIILLLKKH